ncbi:MAG: AAA family ATPase [Clostridia bacterium]|nr:AAA family ATPase [Clostridia bacterium]
MLYLSEFTFPDAEREVSFIMDEKRTCYDTFYPFRILSRRSLERLSFEPITILYGGNGSGKTTAVNVIAETLSLQRDTLYNRSNFFPDYIKMCRFETRAPIPEDSRIITSDDVFDYMLNLRALNEGIDRQREELFQEYIEFKSEKYAGYRLESIDDYEEFKRINHARSKSGRKTQSKYIRKYLMDNPREQSNGESAFFYFTNKIRENGLYLLDEPENSLSPTRQQELTKFLEDSARFFGCQFIIATHSPFLLSMRGARVYNLDADPVATARWTELPAVRTYYDFFMKHASAFEDE